MSSIKPDLTISYKTVGSLEIPMDIYLPGNVKNAPVLLWFHGGGLLQGRRDLISPHMRRNAQKRGYIAISADYRLTPQVAVSEVFEDVKDCIKFIRNNLSSILGPDVIDGSRLAVSGSSAGGFLTLLAGLYIDPKPNVIIPIYPITDPLGTFFINPQPAPNGRYSASKEEMATHIDVNSSVIASSGKVPDDPRSHMYVYMLKTASLAELWGIAAGGEDKYNSVVAEPWRISRRIHQFGLPPTYILHGDRDTAVGVEQADEVAGAMLGLGLDVKYERVHGADHFLDNGDEYDNKELYEFVLKYL
ncbi:Alpha/Beta hydrolase protein [Aspergillus pseudoustus]|uniref:Alpha/Beta hydrolase protein n=1 Tax=Aspergillus pseudoustus TaxID=1810923 RepID=A0ABR4IS34_9EURO